MPVIIGMDPHKHSVTLEIIDRHATVLATGRYGTDTAGYTEMLTAAELFPGGVWVLEGCNGVGKHVAHRLVADGETVIDVPAKLSAQVRVFATGSGRKTDPVDAHSIALAALRSPNLRRVHTDPDMEALGLLVDRRDELGRARTELLNRIHRLLLELVPSGAKRFLSAMQAHALTDTITTSDAAASVPLSPRNCRGRLCHNVAGEPPTDLAGRPNRRVHGGDAAPGTGMPPRARRSGDPSQGRGRRDGVAGDRTDRSPRLRRRDDPEHGPEHGIPTRTRTARRRHPDPRADARSLDRASRAHQCRPGCRCSARPDRKPDHQHPRPDPSGRRPGVLLGHPH
ncbi:MAG: transposase [Nocardia sp.]|nr:transposase [Nocardia sp.]